MPMFPLKLVGYVDGSLTSNSLSCVNVHAPFVRRLDVHVHLLPRDDAAELELVAAARSSEKLSMMNRLPSPSRPVNDVAPKFAPG